MPFPFFNFFPRRNKVVSNSHSIRRSRPQQHGFYESLEPRLLLTCGFNVGHLNGGVAVADDATGTGFIMYSQEGVHSRFDNIHGQNADHFIAVRLEGARWQYNDDLNWVDFETVAGDVLVAEVSFEADNATMAGGPWIVNGIPRAYLEGDLAIEANRFARLENEGEFSILGQCTEVDLSEFSSMDLSSSERKLSQLYLGVSGYESLYDQFPNLAIFNDEGTALLSWRVQILPFIGMGSLYEKFNLDEAWNSPHNLTLLDQMPDVFESVNHPSNSETVFMAVGGKETIFPLISSKITNESISDDVRNTILFVESSSTRATAWTKPRDLAFNSLDPFAGMKETGEGFAAVTAFGETMTIPTTADPVNFANMLSRNDGAAIDFSEFNTQESVEYNLRAVALASHYYESRYDELPAHAIYSDTGEPLLSWRVAILPYIGQQNLFDRFRLDERWDSTNNLRLLPLMPKLYGQEGGGSGMTSVLAVSGPGTIFEIGENATEFREITDGSSNTALFVSANSDQAVEWSRPQDLLFDSENPRAGLGEDTNGTVFAFADGDVAIVPNSVTDANLSSLMLKDDGEFSDFSEIDPFNSSSENLQLLTRAVHNFESSHQELPGHAIYDLTNPGGEPLLSWRVAILPYLEQEALYWQFNHREPWDSPHNLALLPLMPRIFATPGVENGLTVYQAAVHEDTLFLPGEDRNIGFGHVRDGVSNTIMFAETNPGFAVEWTKPEDIEFDFSDPRYELFDDNGAGFWASTADGRVRFFSEAVSDEELGYLFHRDDGMSFETNDLVPLTPLHSSGRDIANNLRQAALAAHNHESAHGELPTHAIYSAREGGEPLLSWRVQLLPFMDQSDLYLQFNQSEPWDSPHNLALLPMMPDIFAHPLVENGMTLMQAVLGDANPRELTTAFPEANVGSRLASFQDGTSRTILFVNANVDEAVEWTKPDDLRFNPDNIGEGFGELFFGTGTWAAFGDGGVRFLQSCLPDAEVRRMLLRNDGEIWVDFRSVCNSGTVESQEIMTTNGDDVVEVIVNEDVIRLTVNGEERSLSRAEFDQVVINTMRGRDQVTLINGIQDEEVRLYPGFASISGDLDFIFENAEDVTIQSGGGHDVAFLFDSEGDDQFVLTDDTATLSGDGYRMSVIGFGFVDVVATQGTNTARLSGGSSDDIFYGGYSQSQFESGGAEYVLREFGQVTVLGSAGEDVAFLTGTSGDDILNARFDSTLLTMGPRLLRVDGFDRAFVTAGEGHDKSYFSGSATRADFYATPRYATLNSGGVLVRANGFDLVTAVAGEGGDDEATLVGSAGNDSFYGNARVSRLVGNGFALTAAGFRNVESYSSTGNDVAVVQDSEGDDQFYSRPYFASMTMPIADVRIRLNQYKEVFGYSINGGDDRATLIDSIGADELVAGENFANLSSVGLKSVANGFGEVSVIATDGEDKAYLLDSAGDDTFFASPAFGYMYGDGFSIVANSFEAVTAFSSGGTDRATLYDSEGDDFFHATPNSATFSGVGFLNTAIGFSSVGANATGGRDQASLLDSDGDDLFFASPERAYLQGNGFLNFTRGFDVVSGLASTGNDTAIVYDTAGNDRLYSDGKNSSMIGWVKTFHTVGFDNFTAYSTGGDDEAYLTDSNSNDSLFGGGNYVHLIADGSSNLVSGFGVVIANGINGGDNYNFTGETDFQLYFNGTWI